MPSAHEAVFISYSTDDADFAHTLHDFLTAVGISTWFAPRNIRGGKRIVDQIDHAIAEHGRMIIVLSESSMESNWVASELRRALALEKESGKQKLFPIRIASFEELMATWRLFDSDNGYDIAQRVREYFIPDFSDSEEYAGLQRGGDKACKQLPCDMQANKS